MPERDSKRYTVWVKYVCDYCNKGTMEKLIETISDNIFRGWHQQCTHCGDRIIFYDKSYPRAEWRLPDETITEVNQDRTFLIPTVCPESEEE